MGLLGSSKLKDKFSYKVSKEKKEKKNSIMKRKAEYEISEVYLLFFLLRSTHFKATVLIVL